MEENEQGHEQGHEGHTGPKVISIDVLHSSMTLGSKLGIYIILVYAAVVLSLYRSSLSLLALPLTVGIPFVAYFLLKKFRDENSPEFYPFPVSWMMSILTFLLAGILSCMAVFLFLKFLKPAGLEQTVLSQMEASIALMRQSASTMPDQTQTAAMLEQLDHMSETMKLMCSMSAQSFTKMLVQVSLTWGNILSLIIGLLVTKRIKIKQ